MILEILLINILCPLMVSLILKAAKIFVKEIKKR